MNSQTVRIASMALRLLFAVQLLLGIFFWTGHLGNLVGLHLLLGLLFVIDVWYLGVVQGLRANGSIGLTLGTFIVGLLLAIVGIVQYAGHLPLWLQIFHLLLAIAAIGLGEASTARYNRGAAA